MVPEPLLASHRSLRQLRPLAPRLRMAAARILPWRETAAGIESMEVGVCLRFLWMTHDLPW